MIKLLTAFSLCVAIPLSCKKISKETGADTQSLKFTSANGNVSFLFVIKAQSDDVDGFKDKAGMPAILTQAQELEVKTPKYCWYHIKDMPAQNFSEFSQVADSVGIRSAVKTFSKSIFNVNSTFLSLDEATKFAGEQMRSALADSVSKESFDQSQENKMQEIVTSLNGKSGEARPPCDSPIDFDTEPAAESKLASDELSLTQKSNCSQTPSLHLTMRVPTAKYIQYKTCKIKRVHTCIWFTNFCNPTRTEYEYTYFTKKIGVKYMDE